MSALRVATQTSGVRLRGQGPIAGTALAIGLVAGVFLGSVGMRPAAAPAAPTQPTTAVPAAKTDALAAYRGVVANIRAAEERHDRRAMIRFGSQLRKLLTAETIGAVYQERAYLLSALAVAKAHGDNHSVAMIRDRLTKLCGTKAAQSYLEFCN